MSGPRLEFRGTWQGKAAKDVERPRLESGRRQAFGCTGAGVDRAAPGERAYWQASNGEWYASYMCGPLDFSDVCTALDALGEPNR